MKRDPTLFIVVPPVLRYTSRVQFSSCNQKRAHAYARSRGLIVRHGTLRKGTLFTPDMVKNYPECHEA